eukprot:jgi/Chlat1/7604/Chrsp64S07091
MATEKSLIVEISEVVLPVLRAGRYKLCIAKQLGDEDFNVIWQSIDNLFQFNEFRWQDSFQVFGQERFSPGAPTTTGPFFVDNRFGLICIGVNAMINGEYKPFYVATSQAILGRITLEPQETIKVFFNRVLTTSCMFNEVSGEFIDITLDYRKVDDHHIVYTDSMHWEEVLVSKRGTLKGEADADKHEEGAQLQVSPGPVKQTLIRYVVTFQPTIQPAIRMCSVLSAYLAQKFADLQPESFIWAADGGYVSFSRQRSIADPDLDAIKQALRDARDFKGNILLANETFSMTIAG